MVHDKASVQKMGVGAMGFRRTKRFRPNETQIDRNNILGKGRDSVVFQGIHESNSAAIKRIELPKSTKDEYKLHAKLSHENVVPFLDALYDDDFRYIVLELCTGSLLQVIKNTYNGPPLPPDNAVLYQLADGLDFIHSKNLIHFDIKPENILISTKGTIKLADFGLSQKMKNGFCILINPERGTYSWMAPEICPSENISDVRVSAMADIFSCGCVFIVFLTRENGGIHPFGNRDDHKQHVQNNIRNRHLVNLDKIIDLPLAHIFLKMIENNPEGRMHLMEVKQKLLISILVSHINQNTFQQTLVLPNPAVEEPNLNITTHREIVGHGPCLHGSTDKN